MKKYIKLLFLLLVIISTLLIYKITYHKGYNYVSLGDSLAAGRNPYGEENYGYSDYVKDYLESRKFLKSYVKDFATSGYTINNLKDDIKNNKRLEIDDEQVSIRKVLRESDIVTISIGANDFIEALHIDKYNRDDIERILENKALHKSEIDNIANNLNDLLIEVKKYAKNEIILVGYYNPLPHLSNYKNEIDDLIAYGNQKFSQIADSNEIYFVDIFDDFDGQLKYFPNPFDIHPNSFGYKIISSRIIEVINNCIIN